MLLSERLSRMEKILDERAGRSPSPLSSDDECLEEFQRRQERSRSRARPRSKIPPVAPHDHSGWQPSPGAVAWVKEVTMNGQSLWIRARQDRRAAWSRLDRRLRLFARVRLSWTRAVSWRLYGLPLVQY